MEVFLRGLGDIVQVRTTEYTEQSHLFKAKCKSQDGHPSSSYSQIYSVLKRSLSLPSLGLVPLKVENGRSSPREPTKAKQGCDVL